MQPSFIDEFVAEVWRTLELRVVGVASACPHGATRALLVPEIEVSLDDALMFSSNCEIAKADGHFALAINLSRYLGRTWIPIVAVNPTTVFTIKITHEHQELEQSDAGELALLYVKFLRTAQLAISDVANQQYLASSSDVLGLRGLIQATHTMVGIDHVAVLRNGLSGMVQILAQHGNIRSLEESDANLRDRAQSREALASTLTEKGFRYVSQKANDPLFPQGSSPEREVIYVGAERYAADALKRNALKGMYYRASTAAGPLSWEQLALLNGLAQAMSVITSVDTILTARLVQLQKLTHSNSSNLSAMQSTLAEAFSGVNSISLASRPFQSEKGTRSGLPDTPLDRDPQLANIESLALSVREHLNHLKLNLQLMQAKLTLSYWLEHEAGLPQNLRLEKCSVLEIIGEIMSSAPALVESWASDYSGKARPNIVLPQRRDVVIVRSRRDILSFVFLNLLENAVKYRSSDRPTLQYEVTFGRNQKTYQREVHILFSDDGMGIDLADKDSIFTMGWRSQRHYREVPGQGLGLYQSRELLQLIGGSIVLTSPRGMTTFTVRLPIEQQTGG